MKKNIYLATLLVGILFSGIPACHAQEETLVRIKRKSGFFRPDDLKQSVSAALAR